MDANTFNDTPKLPEHSDKLQLPSSAIPSSSSSTSLGRRVKVLTDTEQGHFPKPSNPGGSLSSATGTTYFLGHSSSLLLGSNTPSKDLAPINEISKEEGEGDSEEGSKEIEISLTKDTRSHSSSTSTLTRSESGYGLMRKTDEIFKKHVDQQHFVESTEKKHQGDKSKSTDKLELTVPNLGQYSPRPSGPLKAFSFAGGAVIDSYDISERGVVIHTRNEGSFNLALDTPSIKLPTDQDVPKHETPIAILKLWLGDKDEEAKRSKQKRVKYGDEDIDPAFKKFEALYKCNWTLLKQAFRKGIESEKSQDKVVEVSEKDMQVIQDLRSAYNFYIIQNLTRLFASQGFDFHAIDCGSPTLGSDADFGLDVQAMGGRSVDEMTLQAEQAKAIIEFNKYYEDIWKHPSALIFDTNAYSKQYVRPFNDTTFDLASSNYQMIASVTMRLKLTQKTWHLYVDDVLRKFKKMGQDRGIPSKQISEALQKKQEQIQESFKQYTALQNALKVKMIEVALVPQIDSSRKEEVTSSTSSLSKKIDSSDSASHLKLAKWKKFVSELNATIGSLHTTQDVIKKLISYIEANNPDIEIWASNLLHEDTERRCAGLEKVRAKLMNFLTEANLKGVSGSRFNALMEELNRDFHEKNETDDIARVNYLQGLKSKKFSDQDLSPSLDRDLSDSFKKAAELHERKIKIQKVAKSLAEIVTLTTKYHFLTGHGEKTAQERKEIQVVIHQIQEQLHKDLRYTPIKIENENYAKAYQESLQQLSEINSEIEKLYENPLGQRVQFIYEMIDNILLDVQKSTAVGQYFSQEGLMTIGGYAFVVNNLQQKSPEVRSISVYCQAFNEIMGYYESHQRNYKHAFDKLVEASKYGERCILALEELRLKLDLLKKAGIKISEKEEIIGPDFKDDLAKISHRTLLWAHSPQEKLYRLQEFFHEVLLIRKGMVGEKRMENSEKQSRLKQALGNIGLPVKENFDETLEECLPIINEMMLGLATTLEAWRGWLPENIQNI
jgi:hypothetical protein